MSDITDKISQILDDPKSMEQIEAMASSLFGEKDNKTENSENPAAPSDDVFDMPDIGTIMKIGQMLKSNPCDERANLLRALRPHLSEERRPRVDKAVKILRLVSLVPILREQGILSF